MQRLKRVHLLFSLRSIFWLATFFYLLHRTYLDAYEWQQQNNLFLTENRTHRFNMRHRFRLWKPIELNLVQTVRSLIRPTRTLNRNNHIFVRAPFARRIASFRHFAKNYHEWVYRTDKIQIKAAVARVCMWPVWIGRATPRDLNVPPKAFLERSAILNPATFLRIPCVFAPVNRVETESAPVYCFKPR